MNENKMTRLILNPIHINYDNIPKRRYNVPKLNIFGEIKYETIWYCFINDFDNFLKKNIKY
jgi:hypothetical protein